MAPANRRSARKREPAKRKIEKSEPKVSPTRPAKRRKTQIKHAEVTPSPPPADEYESEEDAGSDVTADDITQLDITDQVIPHLVQAKEPVIVAKDFPNTDLDATEGGHVSAFAKVAGKEWTFYVKKTFVRIGRPPDSYRRQTGGASSPAAPEEEPDAVHIDLGPSKTISRSHAEIFYNSSDQRWHMVITGRNGAKLNDVRLKKGEQVGLESGDVIEVAETEMMFVTADTPAKINPRYLRRLGGQYADLVIEEPRTGLTAHIGSSLHSHPAPSVMADRDVKNIELPNWQLPNDQSQQLPATLSQTQPRPQTPVKSPNRESHYPQSDVIDGNLPLKSNGEIDYSSEDARHIKPPCSYATLIAQAILSTPDQALALSGIYDWIRDNFSYYRHIEQTWQNSIRHNLSLSPAFQKVARRTDEPGKGMKWYIIPSKLQEFIDKGLETSTRGGVRATSGPNTPDKKKKSPPLKGKIRSPRIPIGTSVFRTSPPLDTSPAISYPSAPHETSTPQRGGARVPDLEIRHTNHYNHNNNHSTNPNHQPVLSDDASPAGPRLPTNSTMNSMVAGSPSTHHYLSAGHYNNGNGGSGGMAHPNVFATPAPQKFEPKAAPNPSTQRLPSHWLPMSSPAPAWMSHHLHGDDTPGMGRFFESSPLKGPGLGRDSVRKGDLQSSSPPQNLANGSPTKVRNVPLQFPPPNPFNSGDVKSTNGPKGGDRNGFAATGLQNGIGKTGLVNHNGGPSTSAIRTHLAGPQNGDQKDLIRDEADEYGSIDLLSRSFPKIEGSTVTVASSTSKQAQDFVSSSLKSFYANLPHQVQAALDQTSASIQPYISSITGVQPSKDLPSLLESIITDFTPTTLIATLLPLLIALFTYLRYKPHSLKKMSAYWNSPYGSSPGGARSPYGVSDSRLPPSITDDDYTYLTADDIVDPPRDSTQGYPPARTHNHRPSHSGPHPYYQSSRHPSDDDDLAPDVVLLKHRGTTFPLHFPAFSISESKLLVRDIRLRAAEVLQCPHREANLRITLLYKGKKLKDDKMPCREEGLKQNSELMCVYDTSENPGDSTSASESDMLSANDTGGVPLGPRIDVDGTIIEDSRSRKPEKKNKKHKLGRRKGVDSDTDARRSPPVPAPHHSHHQQQQQQQQQQRPTSPLPDPSTPLGKIALLQAKLNTEIVPSATSFLASPPPDPKAKNFEHLRLTEAIMTQVLLQTDKVETEGDDMARTKRKALVKEAQEWMTRLDSAVGKVTA
ncbi:transcription factor [Agyrium rufum]|nr:transcription factor [Agyrium rufum]